MRKLDRGSSAVEYAILVGVIAVALIGAASYFGWRVHTVYSASADEVEKIRCSGGGASGALYLGEVCGDIIFGGILDGKRIYVATSDVEGNPSWGDDSTRTGVRSFSDGYTNTERLINRGEEINPSVEACYALGEGWYLPSRDELVTLYGNKDEPGIAGTLVTDAGGNGNVYWTSTAHTSLDSAWGVDMQSGEAKGWSKNAGFNVRCFKKD